MAISMGAALLGSAVIGAGASAIGASKNSKAINKATDAQTQANAEANRIQQEARNQNVQFQTPFYQTGIAANNRINALLGLGSTGPMESPQMGGAQFGGFNANHMGDYNTPGFGSGTPMGGGPMFQTMAGDGIYSQGWQEGLAPTGQPQQNELQAAQQGFSDWRNNTGYQFRFNEGIRAIDAGAPVRNSGATVKARAQFGQNIGSQEFYNHLGALTGQQQVGVGAANALSGVQTNYANNAANIAQQQGQNLANSAVARANNTNAMIGGITSSFNNALGSYGAYKGYW
jgi:hypothetical protein